jgi:hypothetical protein
MDPYVPYYQNEKAYTHSEYDNFLKLGSNMVRYNKPLIYIFRYILCSF